MNQELLKTIQDTFTLIATQAGVLVERLWIILTKQHFLYGLKQALYGGVVVGLGIWVAHLMGAVKQNKAVAKLDKQAFLLFAFLIAVGLIFWGASTAIDAMPRLFNPEYYSVKDAVEMLQKVK